MNWFTFHPLLGTVLVAFALCIIMVVRDIARGCRVDKDDLLIVLAVTGGVALMAFLSYLIGHVHVIAN